MRIAMRIPSEGAAFGKPTFVKAPFTRHAAEGAARAILSASNLPKLLIRLVGAHLRSTLLPWPKAPSWRRASSTWFRLVVPAPPICCGVFSFPKRPIPQLTQAVADEGTALAGH
jgi:hypothetical protein